MQMMTSFNPCQYPFGSGAGNPAMPAEVSPGSGFNHAPPPCDYSSAQPAAPCEQSTAEQISPEYFYWQHPTQGMQRVERAVVQRLVDICGPALQVMNDQQTSGWQSAVTAFGFTYSPRTAQPPTSPPHMPPPTDPPATPTSPPPAPAPSPATETSESGAKEPGHSQPRLSLAPAAKHQVTKDLLGGREKLQGFGSLVVRCAAFNDEFTCLASPILNIDAMSGEANLDDFFDPIDGLAFSAMQEFVNTSTPGTPRPANGGEWVIAVKRSLNHFFAIHPEYPTFFRDQTEARLRSLAPPYLGDLDRVCDGLVDYIRGVRLEKARIRTQGLDPSAQMAELEKIKASIRLPGSPERWKSVADLEDFEKTPYLVEKLLVSRTVAMMFGPPGDGKTFLALSLGASVASGRPWNGQRTERGVVLYYCLEGGTGFRNRMRALRKKELLNDGDPLVHCTESLDLRSTDAAARILADIAMNTNRYGAAVRLIIIDTLAVATAGGNECTADDMGPALAQCADVVNRSEATVLLLHHPGKDASRGPRGWSGIGCNLDTIIETQRDGDVRKATVTKQKDGAKGQTYEFDLEIVKLGVDDYGGDVTSCVVRHLTVAEAAKAKGQDVEAQVKKLWINRSTDDPVSTAVVIKSLDIAGRGGVPSTRAAQVMEGAITAGLVYEIDRGLRNCRQWKLTPEGKSLINFGLHPWNSGG